MTDPVVLTDDLTRRVHVVPEQLTKACTECGGDGLMEVTERWGPDDGRQGNCADCDACEGEGLLPVEAGDTLELREEWPCPKCWGNGKGELRVGAQCGQDRYPCPECAGAGSTELGSRSAPVVWEGPAAKVTRATLNDDDPLTDSDSYAIWRRGDEVTFVELHPDLYAELGIGSDPDAWVYLVGEAS